MNWEERTTIRLIGGHPDAVNDIATTPTGTFATACGDGSLRVWNLGGKITETVHMCNR